MARPKKDESLRKGKQISIRFSEAEYTKITELAKRQNTTVTDYLRDHSAHGKVETTFQIITDPEEVKERISPWHREWGEYLCFNRTFMKFSDDLYRWLAEKNFVYGTDEETTLVLGARMLEHRSLHIGFMCGDLSGALAFARKETAERHLPSLHIMFRKGYADLEAFCGYYRMKPTGDLIVMERKFISEQV